MTSKFSNLLGLIIPSAHKDDSFGFLGASSPVGEARSLPLKLSPLHRLSEHVSMHELGAKVLNDHVLVCHSFCHPKVTDIYVTRPLRSGTVTLHKRNTTQVVLVDDNRTNGVPLLLHEVLEVDCLSRGVGKANELCLRARPSHDLLLGGAGGQHPCLAEHDGATGVRLPA